MSISISQLMHNEYNVNLKYTNIILISVRKLPNNIKNTFFNNLYWLKAVKQWTKILGATVHHGEVVFLHPLTQATYHKFCWNRYGKTLHTGNKSEVSSIEYKHQRQKWRIMPFNPSPQEHTLFSLWVIFKSVLFRCKCTYFCYSKISAERN